MFIRPVWLFKGKNYSTIAGLYNAIHKDCGAVETSAAKDGIITAYSARPNQTVIARYKITIPADNSKPMTVERA